MGNYIYLNTSENDRTRQDKNEILGKWKYNLKYKQIIYILIYFNLAKHNIKVLTYKLKCKLKSKLPTRKINCYTLSKHVAPLLVRVSVLYM